MNPNNLLGERKKGIPFLFVLGWILVTAGLFLVSKLASIIS
tara:strand:- start:3201 stop:3323 length:123 start_codon:yes stop_codon:yes gene_type:complete